MSWSPELFGGSNTTGWSDSDDDCIGSSDPNNHEKTPPKNDAINEKGFISILNKLPKKELGCSSVCAGSMGAIGCALPVATSVPFSALVAGCPPLFCVGPVG
ncbi:hypothetical protein NMD99_00965 [Wolbachia endosymbiont of Listronotus oregonensis]|uniref:hypothetical protein n=1 Tax=unclassified Wolbachia TaxID=2640676 RepID=UPI0028163212|nr:hypothetical protein [Wolbachia endosymbiont of Listronotus oregonensis]WMT84628.1 hypothetical protein NMD99_00965 [Wolbachia endosymbiont of Listronotus oregonensis]